MSSLMKLNPERKSKGRKAKGKYFGERLVKKVEKVQGRIEAREKRLQPERLAKLERQRVLEAARARKEEQKARVRIAKRAGRKRRLLSRTTERRLGMRVV